MIWHTLITWCNIMPFNHPAKQYARYCKYVSTCCHICTYRSIWESKLKRRMEKAEQQGDYEEITSSLSFLPCTNPQFSPYLPLFPAFPSFISFSFFLGGGRREEKISLRSVLDKFEFIPPAFSTPIILTARVLFDWATRRCQTNGLDRNSSCWFYHGPEFPVCMDAIFSRW